MAVWKRFSTVASSAGSSSTWLSGKVMVWSTTLGNIGITLVTPLTWLMIFIQEIQEPPAAFRP